MNRITELKMKRKASIIVVCTLGLAGLVYVGVGDTWRNNIFQGTSLSQNEGIGCFLKVISFLLMTALLAIPFFFINLFKLIYYHLEIQKEQNRNNLRQDYFNHPMRPNSHENNTLERNYFREDVEDDNEGTTYDGHQNLHLFDVNYYYREGHQLYGPFSIYDLVNLDISENSLLGINSIENWNRAGDIPNLLNTILQLSNSQ
ncbi:MAG: hypothetical protein FWH18_06090 [Marinilabiliaceae bacterium]|nr:hypothetical protein [Marinilabiliaceae bacterium]